MTAAATNSRERDRAKAVAGGLTAVTQPAITSSIPRPTMTTSELSGPTSTPTWKSMTRTTTPSSGKPKSCRRDPEPEAVHELKPITRR